MTKPTTRRYGQSLAFDTPHQTTVAAADNRFITDVAEGLQRARDEDETETPPENRAALKVKIRQEVINELSEKIREGTGKPPPEPTPQAQFIRDPSVDKFFELAQAEKEIKRRRRGA